MENNVNMYIPYNSQTAAVDLAFLRAAASESRFHNLARLSNTHERISEMLTNEHALGALEKEVQHA
jgi:hypothetical protein